MKVDVRLLLVLAILSGGVASENVDGQWSEWTKCDLDCDGGLRGRYCVWNPQNPPKEPTCPKDGVEAESCNLITCDTGEPLEQEGFSPWTAWTADPKDAGQLVRTRTCKDEDLGCDGYSDETLVISDIVSSSVSKKKVPRASGKKSKGKKKKEITVATIEKGKIKPALSEWEEVSNDGKYVIEEYVGKGQFVQEVSVDWNAWGAWKRAPDGTLTSKRTCKNAPKGPCRGQDTRRKRKQPKIYLREGMYDIEVQTGIQEVAEDWEEYGKWELQQDGTYRRTRKCKNEQGPCRGYNYQKAKLAKIEVETEVSDQEYEYDYEDELSFNTSRSLKGKRGKKHKKKPQTIPVTTQKPTTQKPTTQKPTTLATTLPTTRKPTTQPTTHPTTQKPTTQPTTQPTTHPTTHPTTQPTTQKPTTQPTTQPTTHPTTQKPTTQPTTLPTTQPTTQKPTTQPTTLPTTQPTTHPTTQKPIAQPTTLPTTQKPATQPTTQPTTLPTTQKPTTQPTTQPTTLPTTQKPTTQPTTLPTTEEPTTKLATKPTTRKPVTKPATIPTTQRPKTKPTTVKEVTTKKLKATTKIPATKGVPLKAITTPKQPVLQPIIIPIICGGLDLPCNQRPEPRPLPCREPHCGRKKQPEPEAFVVPGSLIFPLAKKEKKEEDCSTDEDEYEAFDSWLDSLKPPSRYAGKGLELPPGCTVIPTHLLKYLLECDCFRHQWMRYESGMAGDFFHEFYGSRRPRFERIGRRRGGRGRRRPQYDDYNYNYEYDDFDYGRRRRPRYQSDGKKVVVVT